MNTSPDDVPFAERPVEYDDTWSATEWDEIIATTQDDVEADRYAFSTEDYPTHEEGMAALWKWMCTLGNGDSDEASIVASDRAGA